MAAESSGAASGEVAFVHSATLLLDSGADPAAPGGAVTVALCGAWEHPPPCTWPHHTDAVQRDDDTGTLELRTVFVCTVNAEPVVRQQIAAALASGEVTGPDGAVARWHLRSSGSGTLDEAESTLAARLAQFP